MAKQPKSRPKAVTLRDVAERAGVHLSTVSRVLNPAQRKMVSDDVSERIREIARDMGYRANPFGYGLRTQKSNTIGVVIPDVTNPVFPPIIRGMEHAFRESGYTAILADSNESVDKERDIVEGMRARQVEGLVLASAHRADKIVEAAIDQGLPVVLINRTTDDSRALSVTNDDYQGAMEAVDHLVGLGHRNIAHLAGPQYLSTGYNRRAGYLAALKRHNIKPNKKLIATCDAFGIEDGVKGFEKLFSRGEPFSAIFAGNDALALGCYKTMKKHKLSCPKDISMIGYNDMPLMDLVQPALTTIRIDLYEMGSRAAHALMKLIADEGDVLKPTVLTPELIVRGSTKRLSAKR
ncbi:MAG: LacI family DNA-binding transcriptional regulator [Hyphomonadaceae bacterium]